MNTNKITINEEMENTLIYFDWDATELEQELPKIFPNANSIEVTDCEPNCLEVNVDGEYFVLDVEGKILEKGRL